MKKTVLSILFLLSASVTYADNFVTLNSLVSINMPGTYPDTFSRGKMEGYATYWYRISYEAISMKDPSVKSTSLTDDELENYYDRFQEKWLKQLGGELKDQNRFYMKGFIGRHVIFEAENKAHLPQLWHSQIIVLEKIVFVFSINAAKGNDELEHSSNEYFGSLCLAEDQVKVHQGMDGRRENQGDNEYDRDYDSREFIRKQQEIQKQTVLGSKIRWMIVITLLSIGFFVIAIGIFFLIRYFYKKYD